MYMDDTKKRAERSTMTYPQTWLVELARRAFPSLRITATALPRQRIEKFIYYLKYISNRYTEISLPAKKKPTSTDMSGHTVDDDDGFNDFLSEDEEETTLREQDMAAVERRLKTVGIREGIEYGKESTLQAGFDAGFAGASADAFEWGSLRGALCAIRAMGLSFSNDLSTADSNRIDDCTKRLHHTIRGHANDPHQTATAIAPIKQEACALLASHGIDPSSLKRH